MIVGPHPLRREVLHLGQRIELVLRQPVVAYSAVEALVISVLLRLAKLDIFDPDALFLGPALERATDVFRPVVAAYNAGLAAAFDDLLQAADYPQCRR